MSNKTIKTIFTILLAVFITITFSNSILAGNKSGKKRSYVVATASPGGTFYTQKNQSQRPGIFFPGQNKGN